MKKLLPAFRSLLFSGLLLLISHSSFASHIVGAELRYKWISGNNYEVTMYLYGDCGPSSFGSYQTLPISTPHVCIYDGATSIASITLTPVAPVCGVEVTPVCPDSLAFTQCTSLSYSTPGVKKFVYSGTYTFPHNSATWRLIYTSDNGSAVGSWSCPGTLGTSSASPASAGRSGSITSISGGTQIQLIDTLNNSATNTRGHNSCPVLTVEPTPYYCAFNVDCYNPGAIDIDDVSPSQPAGDSLRFSLVNATNGNPAGCAIGGSVSYLFGLTGANPLQLSTGTLSFDANTGQMCFNPIVQRSVVVYNIQEYRDDSVAPGIVNHVLVGTMQREMTFRIQTCSTTTPSAALDSFSGGLTRVDSFHVYGCANSGTFNLHINPHETDTSLHITSTATGLSAGFTFSVVGDGTSSPHVTISGDTYVIIPGTYVFYVTMTDNHCPLTGTKTYAFTVDILPVPAVTYSVTAQATCNEKAAVRIIPGGTGKPWTIKVSHNPPSFPITLDTFQTFTFDTSAFLDSLSPGQYWVTIFSQVSNDCHTATLVTVDTPHFDITVSGTDPTYCGAKDGSIVIHGINPGKYDSLIYKFGGVIQPHGGFLSSPAGTDTMFNLYAGTYDSIVVQEGFCFTNPAGPLTLNNPPFVWRTVSTMNASKKCFCDGADTLFGLHPSQLDTITYDFLVWNSSTGVPVPYSLSRTITPDSTVVITGLCAGTYTNFTVKTGGVCSMTVPGPFVITQPPMTADFDSVIHYGCGADTIMFTNLSQPAADLTYRWMYGDGTTDTLTNPSHIYTDTKNATYTIKLFVSNSKCIDSSISTVTLDNYVTPGFSLSPTPYVCQGTPVTFTNSSVGTNLSYVWSFGDGTTDVSASPTHIFTNTGTYTIKLLAADHVIPTPTYFTPCADSVTRTISVDSISAASIRVTDSVICRGQGITFSGTYSHLGDTLVAWTFGDDNATVGLDPIQHSYDSTGVFTVTLNVKYRACPETSATRTIRAYGVPEIYLGPDTAICPGGNAIVIGDERNASNLKARWKWNTGETTSSIAIVKPGTYSTVVTINGCTASDTITVQKDCYMDIPNVFTPNGDGVNDYFFPRQFLTRGVTKFKMSVYNRWGQSIYETEVPDGRGWDGNFNDKPQPAGVYVYLIDVKFKDGQIEHHQGNVTLLR